MLFWNWNRELPLNMENVTCSILTAFFDHLIFIRQFEPLPKNHSKSYQILAFSNQIWERITGPLSSFSWFSQHNTLTEVQTQNVKFLIIWLALRLLSVSFISPISAGISNLKTVSFLIEHKIITDFTKFGYWTPFWPSPVQYIVPKFNYLNARYQPISSQLAISPYVLNIDVNFTHVLLQLSGNPRFHPISDVYYVVMGAGIAQSV